MTGRWTMPMPAAALGLATSASGQGGQRHSSCRADDDPVALMALTNSGTLTFGGDPMASRLLGRFWRGPPFPLFAARHWLGTRTRNPIPLSLASLWPTPP